MYLVLYEEGKMQTISLYSKSEWSIGRLDSTITLRSKIAGRHHGLLRKENRYWTYTDMGSGNGTFYNGQKMEPNTKVNINYGDILRIDNRAMNAPFGVFMLFLREENTNDWKIYDLNKTAQTYIGRHSKNCQIHQPNLYISRRHACIENINGHFMISDCGSHSGTWVNSKRIEGRMNLNEGDVIHLSDCHFYFTGHYIIYNQMVYNPNQTPPQQYKPIIGKAGESIVLAPNRNIGHIVNKPQRPYLIKANVQSKMVPNNSGAGMIQLLKDVNINVAKGSLVAVLGSAGAGKSTIMNCINGIEQDGVTGQILFGNEDLYSNYERLKFQIGCVPQANTFHPDMRVRDELIFAAQKRMTKSDNNKEIARRVDVMIKKLGLEDKKKQQIRKLSGGEQRRVHVGIELVAERLLYCLDEPDAGLDPANKKKLFEILKDLVKTQDKTIMVIIHDVAEIDMFDQVIFMTKLNGIGRLAFSGSPQEARKYFEVEEMKDVYAKLTSHPERYVK